MKAQVAASLLATWETRMEFLASDFWPGPGLTVASLGNEAIEESWLFFSVSLNFSLSHFLLNKFKIFFK